MSKRTLHILTLAQTQNIDHHEEETMENSSDGDQTMEYGSFNNRSPVLQNNNVLLDLENAPFIFLPEDEIGFSLEEKNDNFDLLEFYVTENEKTEGYNSEDCPTNKNNTTNSTNNNCDDNNETLANQIALMEDTNPKIKPCLVPYEFTGDEDEEFGETHQNLATSVSPVLSDPSASQDSYKDNTATPTNSENTESEEAMDNTNDINSSRKRKIKSDKGEWIRNKNKRLRMQGLPYIGFSKKKGEKIMQNQPRKARMLKETCNSEKCLKSKVRYCKDFTNDCRQKIFEKFWSLDWDQRKIFVASHVLKNPTFKRTKEQSRRQGTYSYYLNDGNERLQVCRTMFINTLDIGYKTIQYWVDNSSYGMSKGSEKTTTKDVVRKRYDENYKSLNQFFDDLPKLSSHYCRRNTLKLYLEYSFHSMTQLYDVYAKFCQEKELAPLGRNVFSREFKNKNLSLYAPKKDQCNVCFAFKYGNVSVEEYKVHNQRKEDARQSKSIDKLKAERGEIITLTVDLQAVKLCPYLPANKIYFKTKLCCHNFTVYDLNSRDVMCYWFSENENNQLKASTFVSCIIDYLQENCVTASKVPIVIYSDGCGYQNRNNVLSNALLNFAMKYDIQVFQKYLEPGHTQMECDSVHSVIERSLRYREIHLPSDYASVTIEARKTPKPYGIELLDYKFFQDFSSSKHLRYSSIRPGRKTADPVITDIKCIKYHPNGTIEVKLDFNDDFIQLSVRPKTIPVILSYPPLFSAPPKIKTEKWQHLQELKSVLPKDTHSFYDSILNA